MQDQDIGNVDYFKLIGEAVYLYSQIKERQDYTVRDITTDVVLPLKLNQYRMYWIDKLPVGFVTWCYVSDALLEQLIQDDFVEMTVQDWRGGRNIWIMDLVAPFGHAPMIARELLRSVFANATLHAMRRYPNRAARHTVWRGVNVNHKQKTT